MFIGRCKEKLAVVTRPRSDVTTILTALFIRLNFEVVTRPRSDVTTI